VNSHEIGNIETPVQSRDVRNRQVATDRKMKVTGVEMNHVKFASVLDYLIYQDEFPCHGILAALVFTKRAPCRRDEARTCH